MKKKELIILQQFRKNARENLTKTSRKTGIPVSTIYERLKRYEGDIIRKHTVLLDFAQLGFSLKVMLALKVNVSDRDKVMKFLRHHHRVNSMYKITSSYDVLVEAIFRNLKEYQMFCHDLDSFNLLEKQDFFVIEDIKQEEFLAHEEYLDVIGEHLR